MTDSELKAHFIEKERGISKLVLYVRNVQNNYELAGSDSDESHQASSCEEPQAEVISIKNPLRAENYPQFLAKRPMINPNLRTFPNSSYEVCSRYY